MYLIQYIALSFMSFWYMAHAKEYIRVPAQEEICFFENIVKNENLIVTFQVVSGGYLDVDMKILNSQHEIIHQSVKKTEERVDITAEEDGKYTICFGNTMSTLTAKEVNVGIHAGSGELLRGEIAQKEHLKPVEKHILELSDKVLALREEQLFLRRLGDRHASTADSTSTRVWVSTFFEAAVLLGINLWQIYYLRHFFEVKRSI